MFALVCRLDHTLPFASFHPPNSKSLPALCSLSNFFFSLTSSIAELTFDFYFSGGVYIIYIKK